MNADLDAQKNIVAISSCKCSAAQINLKQAIRIPVYFVHKHTKRFLQYVFQRPYLGKALQPEVVIKQGKSSTWRADVCTFRDWRDAFVCSAHPILLALSLLQVATHLRNRCPAILSCPHYKISDSHLSDLERSTAQTYREQTEADNTQQRGTSGQARGRPVGPSSRGSGRKRRVAPGFLQVKRHHRLRKQRMIGRPLQSACSVHNPNFASYYFLFPFFLQGVITMYTYCTCGEEREVRWVGGQECVSDFSTQVFYFLESPSAFFGVVVPCGETCDVSRVPPVRFIFVLFFPGFWASSLLCEWKRIFPSTSINENIGCTSAVLGAGGARLLHGDWPSATFRGRWPLELLFFEYQFGPG